MVDATHWDDWYETDGLERQRGRSAEPGRADFEARENAVRRPTVTRSLTRSVTTNERGKQMDKIEQIAEQVEESYQRSWWAWEKLERLTFNMDYDEEFEDTLERKYEEGYSDALAMVKRLLQGADE